MVIRELGPFVVYSARSMERMVSLYSGLTKSGSVPSANVMNVMERLHANRHVRNTYELNPTPPPKPESFESDPYNPNSTQLWGPFKEVTRGCIPTMKVKGIEITPEIFEDALVSYWRSRVAKKQNGNQHGQHAALLWKTMEKRRCVP